MTFLLRLFSVFFVALLTISCMELQQDAASGSSDEFGTVEQALSCAPPETCEVPECGDREIVPGPCCDICASLEGEPCGGPWGISGTCGSGLICEPLTDYLFSDGVCVPDSITCMAYWEGWTYSDDTGECYFGGASGCSNPFPYATESECLEANRNLCDDWTYQICNLHSDCAEGYYCSEPYDDCTPSMCLCNPDTGNAGGCTKDCRMGVGLCEPQSECICTLEYQPVCGEDGLTYGNDCSARCSATEVVYEGQCYGDEGDFCGSRGLPECGDGLVCVGGQQEVDIPGTCVLGPDCDEIDSLRIKCRHERVDVRGRARGLAGETIYLDINGEVFDVEVRRSGRFRVRASGLEDEVNTVTVLGCEVEAETFCR